MATTNEPVRFQCGGVKNKRYGKAKGVSE